jgi:hypothetical protein
LVHQAIVLRDPRLNDVDPLFGLLAATLDCGLESGDFGLELLESICLPLNALHRKLTLFNPPFENEKFMFLDLIFFHELLGLVLDRLAKFHNDLPHSGFELGPLNLS